MSSLVLVLWVVLTRWTKCYKLLISIFRINQVRAVWAKVTCVKRKWTEESGTEGSRSTDKIRINVTGDVFVIGGVYTTLGPTTLEHGTYF